MKSLFTVLSLVIISNTILLGQTIDSLKLTDIEIPNGYVKSNNLLCVTPHATSVYTQTDLFEMFLGKVVKKDFQSFENKKDRGSVLYFQFEKDFNGQSFLNGLLWGEGTKPTKDEPDEYFVKGNILIIWSFELKSEVKKVSKDKITRLLH